MHRLLRSRLALCLLVFWAAPALCAPGSDLPLTVRMPMEQVLQPGDKLTVQAVLDNTSDKDVSADIEFTIQRDPSLYAQPAPMPLYGKDIARGVRSWAQTAGQPVIERNEDWGRSNGKLTSINAMTDGKLWTEFGTVYNNKDQWTESFGYIDLGKSVHVIHMVADIVREATRTGKTDFSASLDGKEYTPVEGMQGVDYAKGLGRQDIPVPTPFEARFIRMRLHHDGARVPYFRFPAEFHVYAGVDEHTWDFPHVGTVILQDKLSQAIAAGSSRTLNIDDGRSLQPGCYLVAIRTKAGSGLPTQLAYQHIYVLPPAMPHIPGDSRFGINVSSPTYADVLKQEGNASVRFELRWPDVSPSPGTYAFVSPRADCDAILHTFHDAGFSLLPCLFQTPGYLAPAKATGENTYIPPTDLTRYGEFVFQTVARYGHQKHAAEVLLSTDKLSGLGYTDTYELWSEPGTDNTGTGKFKGPLSDYYMMFRIGAEAAKKADPAAMIANGGWSHVEMPLLESMQSFKYPDGKCPLDFTDILSVRYFSFRVEPELASVYDISHHHEGLPYERTIEQDMEAMVAWRDANKPTMPIWVTAAGHDAMNVDERLQACWLPRGALTALAAGVDKVLVYQDKGGSGFQSGASGILRDDDGSRKPAWFTYATLIRQFEGVTGRAQRLPVDDENIRAYLWKRDGKCLVTAWALRGAAKLNLRLDRCTITDAFGAVQPADVRQSLDLTDFPVYIADFADTAVVQSLQESAAKLAEANRQRLQRQSNLRAYLFNFGQKDREGTIVIGKLRRFTGVSASDLYDDAKGYGFESKARGDGMQPYYQNPLTETSVSTTAKTRFTFKAEPGEYVLQLCVRPPEAATKLIGLEGGDQNLQVPPGGLIARQTVKVGSKPVTLETAAPCALVWMSLAQVDRE